MTNNQTVYRLKRSSNKSDKKEEDNKPPQEQPEINNNIFPTDRKPNDSNSSLDFKPDPDLLERLNQNMRK
jgi:hypothetical protein